MSIQYAALPMQNMGQQQHPPQGAYPVLPQAQPVYVQQQPQQPSQPQMQQPQFALPVAQPVMMQQPGMPPQYVVYAQNGPQPQPQPQLHQHQHQQPLQNNNWQAQLCDCSFQTCMTSMCCPTCRWATTMKRAGIMSYGKALALVGIPTLLFMFCNWHANRSMESMMSSSHHGNEHHGWDEQPIDSVSDSSSMDSDDMDHMMKGHHMEMGSGIMIWLGLMMLLSTFIFAVSVWGRRKIRERNGIPGSCCSDMLMWFFCGVCALAQEATHVDRTIAPHQRITV